MNEIIIYVCRCDHPQCTKMCVGNFDHIFSSPYNVKLNKIDRIMKGLVLEEII